MSELLIELAGWLPAIIFPTATFLQFLKVRQASSAEGVSCLSWFLFGVANLGTYIYTAKFYSIQAIVGFLGSAIVDFLIVAIALSKTRKI